MTCRNGHSYIKLYSRPWRRWFRKTIYLQCIHCPATKTEGSNK